MASRKGLGRGLSALIPPPTAPAAQPEPISPASADLGDASNAPLYIAIARIAPNPGQPRKVFREAELATLAASIREQGVLQPLVVRRRGDGYELIIGERRWRAAQLAGLDEVPAVILDATDRQVVEMALVENVQRADLNPMELAEAFRVLIDDEGMTQDEAGRRVGLDRSSVANHLRLLELPKEIQQDLIDQRLTMGHAKAILQVPALQRMMVRDQVIRSALSVRAAEELGRKAASSAPRQARPGPVRDLHVADLEERLRKVMQTKVRIIGRRARGRIELHYFGEGELDRLSERLLGEHT
ncbi:MAG TPA: ParB/RepB/Spo0J family partition protein [Myxococcota bacterium]|nr:ParB/RepB/Spo0J family partition protein [Myxococcota bacterium]